jgi:DNA-binding response OmpR family regulator
MILDLMIPYLDGFEMLRIIRQKSQIPIIILSAKKLDRDKILSLDLGADEYVEKPFSPRVLFARAKALLRRSNQFSTNSAKKPSLLENENIRIDERSRSIYINGQIKSFTPKEYELLVFFMKNPNRAFTKKQLLESVWAVDDFIDPNTVTVHVRKLREKIEAFPTKPKWLQTIWGVGYKWSQECGDV